MPPRVSASTQGLAPLAPGWRLGLSQVLLAEPELTRICPLPSTTKGCIGWSPESGMPFTTTTAGPEGAMAPCFNG
jgi:hypothetical protein